MPLMELSDEQAGAALLSLADALDSLLIQNDVPKTVRAVLGHIGVRRLNNLANYESSEEKFRDAIQKDIGVEANDAAGRILLSNLIECWKSARNRLKTKDDEAALARAQGRPAPLAEDLFVSMRRSWETLHGEADDKCFPSKFFTNRRIRQLEGGELRAEKLSDVTSVSEGGDEDDDRELDLVITGTSFRATRKYVTVPLPAVGDTEALRHRILLMKVHWDLVIAQFGDKRAFADYDREVWTRHVDFLLGERIFGYRACGLRLSWDDLLNFEWELRRSALKKVNKGEATLCEALTQATKDPDLKQLHFTLPLSTSGRRDLTTRNNENKRNNNTNNNQLEQEVKRLRNEVQNLRQHAGSSSSNQPPGGAGSSNQTPKGKGKSKGKGKGGKDTSKLEQLRQMKQREKVFASLPNAGGLICYYYTVGTCTRGNECKFHHACMRCQKMGHTIFECRESPIPK